MSGQAWCIGMSLVEAAQWLWHHSQGREARAEQHDLASTIWFAAAIIIGSLK